MSLKSTIEANLRAIESRISAAVQRAGRDREDITLVAVSKSVGIPEIEVLIELGITHFGENRVDVAREKIEALPGADLTWHMVGNIQRRKAKDVIQLFDTIDAIDRLSLARTLQQRCEAADTQCRGLIEVNISGESQKHGFAPEALAGAVEELEGLDRVHIDGLLTMAPYGLTGAPLLEVFRKLRELAEVHGYPVVSMGMSGDFEAAIESGATQVRIGRALFN